MPPWRSTRLAASQGLHLRLRFFSLRCYWRAPIGYNREVMVRDCISHALDMSPVASKRIVEDNPVLGWSEYDREVIAIMARHFPW